MSSIQLNNFLELSCQHFNAVPHLFKQSTTRGDPTKVIKCLIQEFTLTDLMQFSKKNVSIFADYLNSGRSPLGSRFAFRFVIDGYPQSSILDFRIFPDKNHPWLSMLGCPLFRTHPLKKKHHHQVHPHKTAARRRWPRLRWAAWSSCISSWSSELSDSACRPRMGRLEPVQFFVCKTSNNASIKYMIIITYDIFIKQLT